MKRYIVFFVITVCWTVTATDLDKLPPVLFSRSIRSWNSSAPLQRRDVDDSFSNLERRARKKQDKKSGSQQQRQARPSPTEQPQQTQTDNDAARSPWTVSPGIFPMLPSVPPRPRPRLPAESSRGTTGRSATSQALLGESPRTPSSGATDQRSDRSAAREPRSRGSPSITSHWSRLTDVPESGAVLASSHVHAPSDSLPTVHFENLRIDSPGASSTDSTGRSENSAKPARWQMPSKPTKSPETHSRGSKSPPSPPDAQPVTSSPTGQTAEHSSSLSPNTMKSLSGMINERPAPIDNHRPIFVPWFRRKKEEIDEDRRRAAKQANRRSKGTGSASGSAKSAAGKEVSEAAAKKKQATALRTIANYDYAIGKETLANNKPGISTADAAFRRVNHSANEAVFAGKLHAQAENAAATALREANDPCGAAKHAGNAARAYSRCILRNSVTKSFHDKYLSTIGGNIAKILPKEEVEGRNLAVSEAVYLRRNYENSVAEYRQRRVQDQQVRNEWPATSSSDDSEISFSDVKRRRQRDP